MAKRVCVLTGASAGIGRAAALALAERGLHMVLVCRSRERGEAAAREVRERAGGDAAELEIADLSAMREVRALAARLNDRYPALHVLVNNAGVLALGGARRLTEDGLELTFAVNVLAPFLLTRLLLDRLQAGAPARVVNVSSVAHRHAKELDLDNLQGERRYAGWRAYCQSKLALNLLTFELARRLHGSGVAANCLHPGGVATNIFRDLPAPVRTLIRLLAASPERGARTVVHLAASPALEGVSGEYFVNERPARASPASHDAEAARVLWARCEALAGLPQEN